MKNRLLLITREGIPYLPELKRVLKNTNATILMQQIEYWFHKKGEDYFYKFLNKPNRPNSYYKAGDSWCEELVFSEKEVRYAFSKIGVAYNSKKAFQEAIDSNKNVFINEKGIELFYCSYHDKMKGITFYYRNNYFVDKFLDNLTKGNNNGPNPPKTKGNPCKLPQGVYRDSLKEFTELPQGKSHISDTTSDTISDKSSSVETEEKKSDFKFLENYSLNSKTRSVIMKNFKDLSEEEFEKIYTRLKADPRVRSIDAAIILSLNGEWEEFEIPDKNKKIPKSTRGDSITIEKIEDNLKIDQEHIQEIEAETNKLLEVYNGLHEDLQGKILTEAKSLYLKEAGCKSFDSLNNQIFNSTKNTFIIRILKERKFE